MSVIMDWLNLEPLWRYVQRKYAEASNAPGTLDAGTAQQLRDLKPGFVMHIELGSGEDFIIMPADDFDHVASLAGVQRVKVKRGPASRETPALPSEKT